jgi:putative transposase
MVWDPQSAPPRKLCERHNTPGDTHFLTFSCLRPQPFLTRDRTRNWLVDSIKAAKEKHSFRLIAYVFMPEHVHLLIHPTGSYDISDILASIKAPVGRKARNFVLKEAPEFADHMTDPDGNQNTLRFWQPRRRIRSKHLHRRRTVRKDHIHPREPSEAQACDARN